jgi:hypothetical protein
MQANIQILREHLAQRLEAQGFRDLIAGSRIDLPTLYERARENYYITAADALELEIVGRVL